MVFLAFLVAGSHAHAQAFVGTGEGFGAIQTLNPEDGATAPFATATPDSDESRSVPGLTAALIEGHCIVIAAHQQQRLRFSVLELFTPDGNSIDRVAIKNGDGVDIWIRDLATHPKTGVVYGVGNPSATPFEQPGKLYTLDLESGAATLIAALSGVDDIAFENGIAFAPDGTLYISIEQMGAAYSIAKIDPGTAVIDGATQKTTTSFLHGLGIDPADGVAYGTTGGMHGRALFVVDLENGGLSSNEVYQTSRTDIAFCPLPPKVPALGGSGLVILLMLLIGGVGLGIRARG